MMKHLSKWGYLAAVLMFAAATFQIASDHFILGAIFFAAAACFASAAGIYQKREKDRRNGRESGGTGNEP